MRINAWWQLFALEKAWKTALDTPSLITERRADSVIDTPWPRDQVCDIVPCLSVAREVPRWSLHTRSREISRPTDRLFRNSWLMSEPTAQTTRSRSTPRRLCCTNKLRTQPRSSATLSVRFLFLTVPVPRRSYSDSWR